MATRLEQLANDIGYLGPAHARTTVTTAGGERLAIPDAWNGKYVDFTAVSQDVYIRFGDSGVEVDIADRSTVASEVLTEVDDTPHLTIFAGTTKCVMIRKDATMTALGETTQTHFAHISGAATGVLRMTVSSGPGT